MNRPHIMVLNVFFAPNSYGGATVVAEEVAHALRRNAGWRVTAVSLISRSDLVAFAVIKSETDGITSYLINLPPDRPYCEGYNAPQLGDCIARLMDHLTPDLVHAHCLQDMGAGVIELAKSRQIPVVLSVHDFWWICERQFMTRLDGTYCGQSPVRLRDCRGCVANYSAAQTRQAFLRRQAALADLVTYPSRFALDLCEASNLAPGKGVHWENGVHLPGPDFLDMQAARRAGNGKRSFGFLGGPSDLKGWPDIRRAFAGVARDDFTVHLADGSADGAWWRNHRFDDLPGDWVVHPRFAQSGMDAFYAQIDVLLFMSQWKETFGLALREALARGIRVIQTDSGGTTEHSALRRGDLIPIGAGPHPLREQIMAMLERPKIETVPARMRSFDDQARQFMTLVAPILEHRIRAA